MATSRRFAVHTQTAIERLVLVRAGENMRRQGFDDAWCAQVAMTVAEGDRGTINALARELDVTRETIRLWAVKGRQILALRGTP